MHKLICRNFLILISLKDYFWLHKLCHFKSTSAVFSFCSFCTSFVIFKPFDIHPIRILKKTASFTHQILGKRRDTVILCIFKTILFLFFWIKDFNLWVIRLMLRSNVLWVLVYHYKLLMDFCSILSLKTSNFPNPKGISLHLRCCRGITWKCRD